jgi:hypothetical protein
MLLGVHKLEVLKGSFKIVTVANFRRTLAGGQGLENGLPNFKLKAVRAVASLLA